MSSLTSVIHEVMIMALEFLVEHAQIERAENGVTGSWSSIWPQKVDKNALSHDVSQHGSIRNSCFDND